MMTQFFTEFWATNRAVYVTLWWKDAQGNKYLIRNWVAASGGKV